MIDQVTSDTLFIDAFIRPPVYDTAVREYLMNPPNSATIFSMEEHYQYLMAAILHEIENEITSDPMLNTHESYSSLCSAWHRMFIDSYEHRTTLYKKAIRTAEEWKRKV